MAVDASTVRLSEGDLKAFQAELPNVKKPQSVDALLGALRNYHSVIDAVASGKLPITSLKTDENAKKAISEAQAALDFAATDFPTTAPLLKSKVASLTSDETEIGMLALTGKLNPKLAEVSAELEKTFNSLKDGITSFVQAQQQAATQQPQPPTPPTPSTTAQDDAAREAARVAEKRLTPHTATERDKAIYKPIETNSTSSNSHNLAMFRFASMVNNSYRKEEITASITKLASMGSALKIIDDKTDPRDIKDPIERAQATQAIATYNKEVDSIAENISASYGVTKEDARKQVDAFIGSHTLSNYWGSGRKEGEYGRTEIFAKVAGYQKQIDAIADKFAVGADGKYDEKKLDEAIAKLDVVIGHEKHVAGTWRLESSEDQRFRTAKQDDLFAVLNDGKTTSHLELQNKYQSLATDVSGNYEAHLATAEAMKDRLVAIKAEHASQAIAQGQNKTTPTQGTDVDKTPPKAAQVVDAATVKTALQNVRSDLAKLTDGKAGNDKDAMKDAVTQMQVAGVITADKAAELQKTIDTKFGHGEFVRTSDAQEMQKQFNLVIAQAKDKGNLTRLDVAVLADTIEGVLQDDKRDVKSVIAAGDTKQKEAVALVDVPQDIQVAGNFTPPSTPAPATKAEDKQAERS